MKKITKDTKLGEVLMTNRKAAEILMSKGLGCLGCPMASEETLEEGCLAHGMTKKQVDELLREVNKR
jgi:hydroxylamine reductase